MLITSLVALVDAGSGDVSVDALVGRKQWGTGWAIGGLVVGAAASYAAIALGRRSSIAGDEPSSGQVADATSEDTAGDPVTRED